MERTGDPTVGLLEPRIHYHNGRIMVVDMCNQEFPIIFPTLEVYGQSTCDALKPGGPLTTRQPAEYKWRSGYPTPLQKIGQSLLCTGSSTQIQTCIYLSQTVQYIQYMSNTATWAYKQYSMYIPTMKPTIYPIVTRVNIFTLKQYIY